jgi:hypothetical protein
VEKLTRLMRAEDRNRVAGGDHTQHPEFNLARWAATNLTPEERSKATVYTSGVDGPVPELAEEVRDLHRKFYEWKR